MATITPSLTPTITPSISPEIVDKLTGSAYIDTILTSFFSIDFMTIVKLLASWLLIAWVLTIIWVFKDAYQRYNSLYMPVFWALLVLPFNLLGLFAYTILRPAEYYIDKEQEEYDIKLLEGEILNFIECPICEAINNRDGEYCTECGTHLTATCTKCGKKVWADWQFCKHCGQELDIKIFDFDINEDNQIARYGSKQSISNDKTLSANSTSSSTRALAAKQSKIVVKTKAKGNNFLIRFDGFVLKIYDFFNSLINKVSNAIKVTCQFVWEVIVETGNLLWSIIISPFVFVAWLFKQVFNFVGKLLGSNGSSKKSYKTKSKKHKNNKKQKK